MSFPSRPGRRRQCNCFAHDFYGARDELELASPHMVRPKPREIDHTHSPHDQDASAFLVAWPSDRLPVEIFEIITSFLTRHEVRNLRLVCREFEAKVSAGYFRNVVVPFKSELYNNLAGDDHSSIKRTSSALFSNGMRIFESFGRHILRFALSLELDEDLLSYPPIKPSQEAIPAFWGIYRWPHSTYHRYTDLEGLEQTADETDAMKEALKCLVKVTNLGLCCDAGLGFLAGPDHIARRSTVQHPVFGTANHSLTVVQEVEPRDTAFVDTSEMEDMEDSKKPIFENPTSFKRTVLRKMVEEAGYRGEEANEAVQLILETEGTSLGAIDFAERRSIMQDYESRRAVPATTIADFEPMADASNHPLVPASLTRAQKEMLLELEWAHRAMIQSYVIGLIDNALEGCFSNLTTLTIAKIPSSHVYIFNRNELWQSLPTITHVSLGIIADWRRISKPAPGCIEDSPISPVEAVSKAYQLLNDYIGAQQNIESLHFEWICGGEFAPGTFQRNHYVLPAPFFKRPDLMIIPDSPRTHSDQLLRLPFIKRLSLKNCWASPHVFLQTFRHLSLASLEKVELETVSLSGPPTIIHQAPLQQHVNGHHPAHNANLLNLMQMANPAPGTMGALNAPPAQDPQFQAILHHQLGYVPGAHPPNLPANPHVPAHGIPVPHAQVIQNLQHIHNLQNLQNFAQQLPPGHAPIQLLTPGAASHPTQETLQQPDWLSWAGIIEHFSPSVKIRDMLDEPENNNTGGDVEMGQADQVIQPLDNYVPRTHRLYSEEEQHTIKSLSFKSCGYVSVDAAFISTRTILPNGAQGLSGNGNPHHKDFSALMQRCRDKLMGRITPFIHSQELFQLVNAFGMDIGWANVYDQKVTDDATADGVDGPGRGRFSGTIDANGIAEPREPVLVDNVPNEIGDGQEFPPFL